MRSMQYIAMTRANAIIDLFISRPLRWLAGKSRLLTDWSPYSMGEALDLVERFFERAQHDGSLFLDASLNIFETIATKQPLFAEWLDHAFTKDCILSPDGSVRHLRFKLTRDELINPRDATNVNTRVKTIEYLEVQCKAALHKMHNPKLAICDKLTSRDGSNSRGKQVCIRPPAPSANLIHAAFNPCIWLGYALLRRLRAMPIPSDAMPPTTSWLSQFLALMI